MEGNPQRKHTFRDAGIFIRIVTLLNHEHEQLPLMCEEVVKTLTSLLSGNRKQSSFLTNNWL